jgi:hemoglobin
MRPTLYEFAGGDVGLVALARAHHANCVADPVLNHMFDRDDNHPQHVERLAAYWAEVLGGPPTYSKECGNQSYVLGLHCGNGPVQSTDLGDRFYDCFVRALDDAGLPNDHEFRAALAAYMRWAVVDVLSGPAHDPSQVEPGLPMPRWGWDGREAVDGAS